MDRVAGIDVHKKMLAVVVSPIGEEPGEMEQRKFGTSRSELRHLCAWFQAQGVVEVVMESTAQYWRPVWLALEGQFQLHLAQAQSNRAAHGRKSDFRDAERLVRRLLAGELVLSYVPEAEQRSWRDLMRTKYQRVRERIRLQSQVECLLEQMQIKLSSVISDLFGASGRRMLGALAQGDQSLEEMVKLADRHLKASPAELRDALDGQPSPIHRQILQKHLELLRLLDDQIAGFDRFAAEAMGEHSEAIARLVEIPGIGVNAAHQILAELGPRAAAFPSAGHLASWVGVCPGENQSAGVSYSERSAKGNRTMRRLLAEVAHAAVHRIGCRMEVVFRRSVPRLGYSKAIWAIAHRLGRLIWKVLHEGVRYIEFGTALTEKDKNRRARKLLRELSKLGYSVHLEEPLAAPQG